jgi:hypothetical protein
LRSVFDLLRSLLQGGAFGFENTVEKNE